MKEVVAVKISYGDKDRISFNFYAELFRLLGFYVEEDPTEEEKRDYSYQLCLRISDDLSENGDTVCIQPGYLRDWNMSRSDEAILEGVSAALDRIQDWCDDHDKFFPCTFVKQILPIYVKNNVLKGAMQLQYYRIKTRLHQETERIFQNTLKELEALEQDSQYLSYAKLYCKQKANLSCYFQKEKPLDYAIHTLVDDCDDLIRQYPDFSNAKVLKGMICERSNDGLKMAINSYRKALDQVGEKPFASHIYYWVGLLYEKFINNQKDAAYAYRRSYQLKRKYRNIYKVGYMAEKETDYSRAVDYYKECVEFLEKKIRGNMDPLEIEYYFKTGVLISFQSQRHLEDYAQAIDYGNRMMRFYEQEFSDKPSRHFEYWYGPDALTYQELSERRLKCKKLYECLAIAYRESGNMEESEKYWKLAEQA